MLPAMEDMQVSRDARHLTQQDLELNEKQLEQALRFWTTWLGISSWYVEVQTVCSDELPNRNAEVQFCFNRQTARVLMRRFRERGKFDAYDMEQTLVHELLHLVFSPWDRVSGSEHPLEEAAQEQPVDFLAWSLVGLRRGNYRFPGDAAF